MQLPKAVLRHISDSPLLSAVHRHVTYTADWLTADARSHSAAHQRWWAALAAVAIILSLLSLSHQHVVPAAEPLDGLEDQSGTEQQHPVHGRRMNAIGPGAWYPLFGNAVPALLSRWSDFERDAPDEPAGHPARHVPSRHMHKQTVWYRSVIDNTTRLNAADTRALQVRLRMAAVVPRRRCIQGRSPTLDIPALPKISRAGQAGVRAARRRGSGRQGLLAPRGGDRTLVLGAQRVPPSPLDSAGSPQLPGGTPHRIRWRQCLQVRILSPEKGQQLALDPPTAGYVPQTVICRGQDRPPCC
jgi:hypothetical protein